MTMDQVSGLLTVAETARLLRRSTEQVRRYLREGVIPGRRVGGQWFINRAAAERFMAKRGAESVFVRRLVAVDDPDPLAATIAIGGSGGGTIAAGKTAYLQAQRGARRT
jgi:excisionase family DNA binding protein